ncbi:MAG: response regulator [Nitrospirota bacterium]|nr:MAG: response regulator [Nitrospirota bacterium]
MAAPSSPNKSPASPTSMMNRGFESDPQPQVMSESATTTLLPSILVVDDDPSVLEMVHDALDLWGFDVFLAKNGREGLNVLARQKVDGILLDMDMPVMDGLTMLDELRWLGYPMPVVIMSGAVKVPSQHQRVEAGAQGFMSKPFSLSFLRDVCATIFENNGVEGCSADRSHVA